MKMLIKLSVKWVSNSSSLIWMDRFDKKKVLKWRKKCTHKYIIYLPWQLRQSSPQLLQNKSSFRRNACTAAMTAHGPPPCCSRAVGSFLFWNIKPWDQRSKLSCFISLPQTIFIITQGSGARSDLFSMISFVHTYLSQLFAVNQTGETTKILILSTKKQKELI